MPTRDHNPVPQPKGQRKPMQTSPDDDEAQAADETHAGDLSEPEQQRRRHEQEMDREQEKERETDEAGLP